MDHQTRAAAPPLADDFREAALLDEARDCAQRNVTDAVMFGHLAPPAGATTIYAGGDSGDGWSREFADTHRKVAGATVYIDGKQYPDGRIERGLTISVDDLPGGPGGDLTAEQARQLATALVEAAERWTGSDSQPSRSATQFGPQSSPVAGRTAVSHQPRS